MITYYESENIEIAVLEKVKPGNYCCGDAHTIIHTKDYTVCAVVDGLGSGEGARQSAVAAVDKIQACHEKPVEQIVEACNEEMFRKRGVVMTIIKFDYSNQEVFYGNIGNVGFVMYLPDGTTIQPIPIRGYLSGKKQKVVSHRYPFRNGSTFTLYSDGVITPPTKETLMKMDSPRNSKEVLFPNDGYAIDDVSLLVGKVKVNS